jgi:hypothetical protein
VAYIQTRLIHIANEIRDFTIGWMTFTCREKFRFCFEGTAALRILRSICVHLRVCKTLTIYSHRTNDEILSVSARLQYTLQYIGTVIKVQLT